MLKVTDVNKWYGDCHAVSNLSFCAEEGKIYGLIGPNGAGKSTSIRIIMNILQPDSGLIELDDKPFSTEDRNRIGYLPEERGLYRKQKLNDVLLYLAALKGCPARLAQERIDYWLRRFDLFEWKNKKLDTLSKGMSQKVQFISTIVHDPEIIFLDEPFSGLDPVSADEMLAIVQEMKKHGKLVLFSTHVMEQAEKVCDHIIMLNKGRKVLDGSLQEIRQKYGQNTVSVSFSESSFDTDSPFRSGDEFLRSLESVSSVQEDGHTFVVALAPGFEPDSLFSALAGRARVLSFAVNEPSLHTIFVNLVQQEC